MIEFLIDENILGLDKHLDGKVKYQKVGDDERLPLGSLDLEVTQFANDQNLVIITADKKLIKQCEMLGIQFVTYNITDLAKNVLEYSKYNLSNESI